MTTADGYRRVLLTSLLAAGMQASANELETTITLTVDYEDNVFRDRDDEVADLKRTPSVNIDYLYEFTNVTAVLGYSVKRVDYRDDSFSDRTDFIGEGSLDWSIIDNRFSWSVEHNRNRLSIDSQNPDTPENEDDRTVLRTGPTINLISGARTNLQVTAAYGESNADQTQDSTVANVGIDFSQRLTDSFTIGVFGQVSEIKPETELQEYDNERFGIRISRRSENLNLELEYGTNEVDRATGDNNSSPYYSATLSWSTTNSELVLRANRELTDSNLGLSLNQNVGDGLDNGDGNLGNQDVIDRYHHELSYSINFQKVRLSLGFTFDEQDFQILNQDETTEIASISLSYDFSQRLGITYSFSQEKNVFSDVLETEDELVGKDHSLLLRYRVNDALSLQMELRDVSREFDNSTLRDYEASGASITLSYRF